MTQLLSQCVGSLRIAHNDMAGGVAKPLVMGPEDEPEDH